MTLIGLKVVFSIAVFAMGAFGVLFPSALRRAASGDRFMAWGDTFAGGVLGGAGLVHLLSGGALILTPYARFPALTALVP